MTLRFFQCSICGNVIVKCADSGVMPSCCGKEMKEIVPGTSDGSREKHVPVVEMMEDGNLKVKVGAEPHPMLREHYISFICLETEHGFQLRYLDPTGPAEAVFCICGQKPVAVYEYCNIHGLYKTEIKKHCCR